MATTRGATCNTKRTENKQQATTPDRNRQTKASSARCGAKTIAVTFVHFLPQARVNRLVRPSLLGSLFKLCAVLVAATRACATLQYPTTLPEKQKKHRKTQKNETRKKKHTQTHTHTQNRVAGLELTPSVPLLDETFTPYTRTRGHLATPLRPCREGFVLWRK